MPVGSLDSYVARVAACGHKKCRIGDQDRVRWVGTSSVYTGSIMVPKKKKSKCDKRKRRSHHALTPAHLVPCPKCGKVKLPHAACGTCGFVNPKLLLSRGAEES